MFHQKASGTAWPFFVFGLLGISIIAAGVLLFVVLLSRVNDAARGSPAQTPETVSQTYQDTIGRMRQKIAEGSGEEAGVLLSEAEDLLFHVRVPKDYLESHLHALLRLRTLAKKQAEYGGEKTIEELRKIFEDLM